MSKETSAVTDPKAVFGDARGPPGVQPIRRRTDAPLSLNVQVASIQTNNRRVSKLVPLGAVHSVFIPEDIDHDWYYVFRTIKKSKPFCDMHNIEDLVLYHKGLVLIEPNQSTHARQWWVEQSKKTLFLAEEVLPGLPPPAASSPKKRKTDGDIEKLTEITEKLESVVSRVDEVEFDVPQLMDKVKGLVESVERIPFEKLNTVLSRLDAIPFDKVESMLKRLEPIYAGYATFVHLTSNLGGLIGTVDRVTNRLETEGERVEEFTQVSYRTYNRVDNLLTRLEMIENSGRLTRDVLRGPNLQPDLPPAGGQSPILDEAGPAYYL